MAMAHQTQLSHDENSPKVDFDVPETKNRVSNVKDDPLEIGLNVWFLSRRQRWEWLGSIEVFQSSETRTLP